MKLRYLIPAALIALSVTHQANAFGLGNIFEESMHLAEKSGEGHYSKDGNSHTSPSGQRAQDEQTVHINSEAIVAFSPNGDATKVIVDAIKQARSQILVQAYSFTSKPILAALANAKERGVDVRVIADKTNDTGKYSGATYMTDHGVPVWIDDSVQIAHNKVMIFDGKSILTGSFNFSQAAQKDNAENVLYIKDCPQLAAQYTKDWQWRLGYSRKFGS